MHTKPTNSKNDKMYQFKLDGLEYDVHILSTLLSVTVKRYNINNV